MSKPSLSASLIKDIALCDSPLKTKGALTIIAEEHKEALPLDLLLVLDVSGSMQGPGISVVTESMVHILNDLMRPEDRIAVITFNSSANVHTTWTNVSGTITPLSAGGGTNFGSAINQVLSFLGGNDNDGQRAGVALFLSDGQGQPAKDENVSSIPDFGFTMHTIGVTAGANPTHLEQMAELARGHYYHAPGFEDVKKAFQSIFNYGKTIVYAAPELDVTVSGGVTLSNIIQTPQGLSLSSHLGPGVHSISLSHLIKDTRMEIAFEVSIDKVSCEGQHMIATFSLGEATTQLSVRGTNDETELYNAPMNTDVTMIAHSAIAATAIKKGDEQAVTRAITQMEKLGATNPNANTRTKIISQATQASTQGERMEILGKMQSDTSGKTKLRED